MSDCAPGDNPFARVDPTKCILLGGGKPLIPREMPRCMVYMFGLSGEPVPLRLWDCQAWGTDAGTDIVYTHDKQWAFGDRDERATEKYAIQTFSGFRLNEVKAVAVIALCNQLDHILPPPLIPSAHSLIFPEKQLERQWDYHPPAKNDEGNVSQRVPKQAGRPRRNKGGRPADTDAKQDRCIPKTTWMKAASTGHPASSKT